jgi:hypothetical protein
MKFGIREVCDCKFTKLSGVGPVEFIIDTDNADGTMLSSGSAGCFEDLSGNIISITKI